MKLKIRYRSSDAQSVDLGNLCGISSGVNNDGKRINAIIIKDDKTTTLCKVESGIGMLMVKRYNTKNYWHGFRRNFQTSRAQNCLSMSRVFSAAGIKVAEPVAVLEDRLGPVCGRSWYICRYVPATVLTDFIDRQNLSAGFDVIAAQIIKVFALLKRYKLSHGDMKATNLLVSDGHLIAVDLDAARHHRLDFLHRRALNRDKIRFLANWNSQPEIKNHFEQKFRALGI